MFRKAQIKSVTLNWFANFTLWKMSLPRLSLRLMILQLSIIQINNIERKCIMLKKMSFLFYWRVKGCCSFLISFCSFLVFFELLSIPWQSSRPLTLHLLDCQKTQQCPPWYAGLMLWMCLCICLTIRLCFITICVGAVVQIRRVEAVCSSGC